MPSPEFEGRPEFGDSERDSPVPEVLVPSWGSFSLSAALIFQGGVEVGRRSLALPNAKSTGIKPLLNAGFKCRGWSAGGK